jgi:hypothetical protein
MQQTAKISVADRSQAVRFPLEFPLLRKRRYSFDATLPLEMWCYPGNRTTGRACWTQSLKTKTKIF